MDSGTLWSVRSSARGPPFPRNLNRSPYAGSDEQSHSVDTSTSDAPACIRPAQASRMSANNLPLRILFIHAYYRQRGGEEALVAAESALLRAHGHPVAELRFDNATWAGTDDLPARLRQGLETIWSTRARRRVRRAVDSFRPELVHVHNTFPSASP